MSEQRTIDAFNKFGNNLIKIISDQVIEQGFDASGKSIESLRFEFDTNKFILYGSDSFQYMESGRGPGKFPPPDPIFDWVRTKNIIFDGMTQKSTAFVISRKIAEEGTAVFRGDRKGLNLSAIFSNQVDSIIKTVEQSKAEEYSEEIINATK